MTEEAGEAAEERRRIARAEIMRRAALLEARRSARETQRRVDSFDTLVDQEGNLRMSNNEDEQSSDEPTAKSTGVDMDAPHLLRRGKVSGIDAASMGGDQLNIDIPSGTPSHHPSESVLQFTPTSEDPDGDTLFDPFADSPIRGQSPAPASVSASSHTEESHSIYYAHPNAATNFSQQPDLIADLDDFSHGNTFQHEVSSAPSTTGSFSHVHGFTDESSDGTLSDLGAHSVGGIATPASWSEVGSVISDHDAEHHQLL